jgi:hypothetical protein
MNASKVSYEIFGSANSLALSKLCLARDVSGKDRAGITAMQLLHSSFPPVTPTVS